ncbi:MAG: class I SAM-dependent methyltransferase [Chlorobi bacterium]|nr:class I SAM-dependent methyltransferase [Chlorobiota bacterium]
MAKWNKVYSTKEFFYGKNPNEFIKKYYGLIPQGGRVLELACGEGRNAIFLAQQGFHADAIDLSEVAIEKAESWTRDLNVEVNFINTDAFRWTPQYRYDGIIITFFHAPPEKRILLYQKIKELLKPEGIFLGEWFSPLQRLHGFTSGGPPFYEYMPTIEELKDNFQNGEILLLETEERVLHEGSGHRGPASLVHLIWRKK